MTDRIHSITVVLEDDMREDDAADLIALIGRLRGVLSATGNVTNLLEHVARDRVRRELRTKLWEALEQ